MPRVLSGGPGWAARALLDYATAVWPQSPPSSLGAVAVRLTGDSAPVRQLDRVLYAPEGTAWTDGEALWACVEQGLRDHWQDVRTPKSQLPPLYPKRV